MFEIHLTVETNDIDKFKTDCINNNVKPIVIALQDNNDKFLMLDVMTSSKHNHDDYIAEAKKIKKTFEDIGYITKRIKVEVNPYYYNINEVSGKDYFESHFRILTNSKIYDKLKQICINNNYHLSKNMFKKLEGDNFYIMSTIRLYNTTLKEFEYKIENFKTDLQNFKYDKIEVECCLYDTNIEHDNIWI